MSTDAKNPVDDRFQRLLGQLADEHSKTLSDLSSLRTEHAALSRTLGEHAAPRGREPHLSGSCSFMSLPGTADTDEGTTSEAPARPERQAAAGEGACTFQIKRMWLRSVETGRLETAMKISTISSVRSADVVSCAGGGEVESYTGPLRHVVSYPGSPPRMAWDLVGAALIFYDVFAIPLIFTFEPPEGAATAAINWLILIFWTLDVFASLLVGYVKDGITHMDPMSIAARYARTWLLVDLLVVVPDWGFTLSSSLGGQGGSSSSSANREGSSSVRLLRVLRLCRMVRLLRLFKLRKIIQNLNELIDSEYVGIIASIGKMILVLLVINHYIGCAWFLVGTAPGLGTSWVREHHFQQADWTYQYSTSFHWAITQFTPASMHVQPQNVVERLFAVVVVIFALVGFAYVVGSITGSLTQLRSMQENVSKQFWGLRCYLKQNRVSMTLSVRVQRYLEHALKSQRATISRDKIPLFSLLSEQLLAELQSEIYVPQLSVHPLLKCLRSVSSVTMGRVANNAIGQKELARNDNMFIPGEAATHASFVRSGRLQYIRLDSRNREHREWVDNSEDWIAEQVLWLSSWAHLGRLTAMKECELLSVDPTKFSELIYLSPPAFHLASTYARNFLGWLQSLEPDLLSDVWQGEDAGPRVRRLMGQGEEPRASRSVAWAVPVFARGAGPWPGRRLTQEAHAQQPQ